MAKTAKNNNGITERDTTFLRIAQRQSAEFRRCPKCNRKGAMVKTVNLVGYHLRRCRYCHFKELNGNPIE